MAETFNYQVRAEPSGQVTHRTLKADFGDGYSQAAADGINTRLDSWNLAARGLWTETVESCANLGQPVLQIARFIDERKGYQAFNWTPPLGVPGLYRCDGYSMTKEGQGVVTLNFTFYKVYAP